MEEVFVGCGLKAADFPRLHPEAVIHSALIRVQCHQMNTHAHAHTQAANIYKCQCVFFITAL